MTSADDGIGQTYGKGCGAARTICLHDKGQIEAFLRRNVFLHSYSVGDLDDRFWPHTTWYALADGDGSRPGARSFASPRASH